MRALLFLCPLAGCQQAPQLPPPVLAEVEPEHAGMAWTDLLGGRSPGTPGSPWAVTAYGGEGDVSLDGDGLLLGFGSPLTGVNWTGEALPRTDYELEVTASRLEGSDFFCGLTFPVGKSHLTLILGGWGGALTGLSSLEGLDASENGTASYVDYGTGQPYTARVRVEGARVRVWLREEGTRESECLHDIDTSHRAPSLRMEMLPCRPLGIAAYATRARIHSLRLRHIEPVWSADFGVPADRERMEYSDPATWGLGAGGRMPYLELFGDSSYAPPHRSPRSVALVRDLVLDDFELVLRAQQTGREYGHRDLCLFLAWRDSAHFAYVHLASAPDDRAHNLFLVDGAARRRLGEVGKRGVDWGTGLWHDLRLVKSGASVRVFFDGDLAIDVDTGDPLPAGRVGLGSFDDTGRFAALHVFAEEADLEQTAAAFEVR